MKDLEESRDWRQIGASCLIGFYIMYNVFLVPMGFFVPRLSVLVLLGAGILTLSSRKIRLTNEYKFLIGFIVYSFITGFFIAHNSNVVVNRLLFLTESVVSGIIILGAAKDSSSFRLIIGFFALGSILAAAYFFLNPSILVGARLSFDENFNSNTLGVMLMYGVWSIIYVLNCDKVTAIKALLTIVLILLVLFIIVQTGSRKSVLGALGIVVLYFIFLILTGGGSSKKKYGLLVLGVVIGVIVYVYKHYLDSFLEAADTFINRMEDIEGSENNRLGLIIDSFRVFAEHPLFGVGLDNNRYYTIEKLYAHNSYVEILACTGIIGAFLFFPIFGRMLIFLFKGAMRIRDLLQDSASYYIYTLILVYLLICMTQINIYNQTHMFITYFILTYISMNSVSNEKKNNNVV